MPTPLPDHLLDDDPWAFPEDDLDLPGPAADAPVAAAHAPSVNVFDAHAPASVDAGASRERADRLRRRLARGTPSPRRLRLPAELPSARGLARLGVVAAALVVAVWSIVGAASHDGESRSERAQAAPDPAVRRPPRASHAHPKHRVAPVVVAPLPRAVPRRPAAVHEGRRPARTRPPSQRRRARQTAATARPTAPVHLVTVRSPAVRAPAPPETPAPAAGAEFSFER